jgi:DNA-directed RNA polymerase specialized sigma24 family protein
MPSAGSVTGWIVGLKAGEREVVQKLWERYFARLVRLARTRLRDAPRRFADEEDVALSAFDSFCRGAEGGRFPLLSDRENLWPLLVLITRRKACDLLDHERRARRGGGKVLGEADLAAGDRGIEQVIGRDPTPEFAAQVAEQWQRLQRQLADEQLRTIALLKLENYSEKEIAAKVGCAVRTVRRRVQLIRALWEEEAGPLRTA